uniref:class I SAM-dependent methyltransferase n=1 Tax=Limnohabitans sp. TaxID=1907725 RepID=UPI0040486A3C
MSVIHRRDSCRVCESKQLDLVFALKPSPIGDAYVTREKCATPQPSYPIDLFMCRQCGLAQLSDVISPDVLYGDYIYVTSSSLGLAEHFDHYAAGVISKCRLPSGSLVVDVGSNDGTLLGKFKARGMRVLGVEPASHIATAASAAGIPTISAFFNSDLAAELVREHGRAQVITANNMFANVDDLYGLVKAIEFMLAPEGVFVMESSYLGDLVDNLVFDFIYHEHLSSFSVRPIRELFKRVGLELVAVQHVPTKGGSLRYFLQRPGGRLVADSSVANMLEREEKTGLYRKETFEAFAATIDGLKKKLHAFLAEQRGAGKIIAGFGASITSTTLIYHFEIGEYLDYLVDDNAAKHGRFSPGLHLPVLPTSVLREKRPDCVVALAWRYAEPFILKNGAYLDDGGTVVTPVPEFKIIRR